MKLLLIEDDAKLVAHLTDVLRDQGFHVTALSSEKEISTQIEFIPSVDLMILDRLIGSLDTKSLVPSLRKRWPSAPIIILSAVSTPNERTDLLNLGADDYLGKPFSSQELVARIRALLRRAAHPTSNYIQIGNVVIDLVRRVVSVKDTSGTLPSREFALLRTLSQEPGRVWSKNDLLDYVWGQSFSVETNVVEATVTNLRKKLIELGASPSIKNLRNTGYWIEI